MQFSNFSRDQQDLIITLYNSTPLENVKSIKYYSDNATGNFTKKEFRWSFNNEYWSAWETLTQSAFSRIQTHNNYYLFFQIRYVGVNESANVTSFTVNYIERDFVPEVINPWHVHDDIKNVDPSAVLINDIYRVYQYQTVYDASLLNGYPGSWYLDRSHHYGTQPISSIIGLKRALDDLQSAAGVTQYYVDGSLALRDASIDFLFLWNAQQDVDISVLQLGKQDIIPDGYYLKETSLGSDFQWDVNGQLELSASAQGIQGIQGEAGYIGADGAQGIQGIQGIAGYIGADGAQGIQGIQGVQGSQGIQGTAGYVGADGVQGIQGITGSQGTAGTQGIQGTTGSQGIQGTIGSQGVIGAQGIQGRQGTVGSQGIQGTIGTQGIQGITGSQGTQGTVGSQGTIGSQGIQGRQGTQGRRGTQGTQGRQGIQGTSFSDASYNQLVSWNNSQDASIIRLDASIKDVINAEDNFYTKAEIDSSFARKTDLRISNLADVSIATLYNNDYLVYDFSWGVWRSISPIALEETFIPESSFGTSFYWSGGYLEVSTGGNLVGASINPMRSVSFANSFESSKDIQEKQGIQGIQGIQGTSGIQGMYGMGICVSSNAPTSPTWGLLWIDTNVT